MRKFLGGLVFSCTVFVSVHATDIKHAEHKAPKPVLSYITQEHFDAQRKFYKRILSNQKWRQRLLYCSAGAAAGGIILLFADWVLADQNSHDSKKIEKNAQKAHEKSYDNIREQYLEEELEQRRYRRTLWGSIDNGVRQGLGLAFASFITAFVLNHMNLFSQLFKEKYQDWFYTMDEHEYALLQSMMKSQFKIFGNSLIESIQPALNTRTDTDWEESFVDRIAYISGDLVADQAAWLIVIEKLYAFSLEALHEGGLEEEQLREFEASVYRSITSINFFSEKLELCMDEHGVIRDEENAQKLMLLLKKNCRDIFQIVHTAGTVLYGHRLHA